MDGRARLELRGAARRVRREARAAHRAAGPSAETSYWREARELVGDAIARLERFAGFDG